MFMPNKVLVICCALFLVLASLLALAGCGSEISPREISSNAINNSTTVNTTKWTSTFIKAGEVTGGSNPGNFTMLINDAGSMNLLTREIQMTSNGSMDTPGVKGNQSVPVDVYVIDGWQYVKTNVPGEGYQWFKQKFSDDAWTSEYQVNPIAELLKAAHNITKLGDEKVDGVDCYIIQFTPDMNATVKSDLATELGGFVMQALSAFFDFNNLDLGKMVKSYSVKEWITKDGYLPVKAYSEISVKILPQDLGNTTVDMDKMTINISAQIKYYDYNKPVVIQLPPEAQNAKEWPSQ